MSRAKSPYHDDRVVADSVAAGRHRDFVGGMWDDIGRLQADYLIAQGLRPEHRLLDIGCGALRGGVHFIRHLAPGHYFGIDRNQALIEAGYDQEVAQAGLTARQPRENLKAAENFDASGFGVRFDMGLAFSLFTHVPLNDVRICLERWAEVAAPQSVLYATIFAIPDDAPSWAPFTQDGAGIVSHGDRDPYHCRVADMAHFARALGLSAEEAPGFSHPRGQIMIAFRRG